MKFFNTNKEDEVARQYIHREFPEHYVWHFIDKYWSTRKTKEAIGRIVMANPSEGERYYLRIL